MPRAQPKNKINSKKYLSKIPEMRSQIDPWTRSVSVQVLTTQHCLPRFVGEVAEDRATAGRKEALSGVRSGQCHSQKM